MEGLARAAETIGVMRAVLDMTVAYASVREQLVFPEVSYDSIDKIRGMEISIVTTAHADEEGRRLLELLGMPFRRRD